MKSIASHNGLAATQKAYELLAAGRSTLDAVVEGVTLIEDDPDELTVGYGGLPNEDGVVQLDAAVMDGPTHRAGAVAALEDVRHAAKVARLVMEQTKRVMLVGEGARRFALANGFPAENLLTEKARRMWHYWRRRRSQVDDWLDPTPDEADLDAQAWFDRHFYHAGPAPSGGTVHCSAIDAAGNMSCTTTTSGHAFKLAGRVGDSPILGAGLYVDNDVGSCGSIGHGEANMQHLSSFAVVELMRQGRSPRDAGMEILQRIAAKSPPYERDAEGRASFNLQLFILASDGTHAGVAMWGPKQIAVTDSRGTRLEDCTALYSKDAV
jgi:N4-(beta-N-acetylglucosaminyl)-L-asparaginase